MCGWKLLNNVCIALVHLSFFLFSLVFFFSLFFLFVVLTEREDGIQNVGIRSADRIGQKQNKNLC